MKKLLLATCFCAVAVFLACGGGDDGKSNSKRLAVALRGVGQVAIVDLSNNGIVERYAVGENPQSIAITPDKKKFYVTDNYGEYSSNYLLHVVDVSNGNVETSINLGGAPWGVKMDPDGTKAYVTLYTDDVVLVIDTTTNEIVNTVEVGDMPVGLAINKAGTKLCVPNRDESTISIIDTATLEVTNSATTSGTGSGPWEVAFTPDGKECWVDDSMYGDVLSVFDVANVTEIDTTTLAMEFGGSGGLQGIVFTPSGGRAFVGSAYSTNMWVLDTSNLTTLEVINTGTTDGGYAKRMAMDRLGRRLYYSSREDDTITVISVSDYSILDIINFEVGDQPNGLVLY